MYVFDGADTVFLCGGEGVGWPVALQHIERGLPQHQMHGIGIVDMGCGGQLQTIVVHAYAEQQTAEGAGGGDQKLR